MPKERPFDWFSKTHLRHAREGKYRDVWHLNRYYNPALDRFVRKSGTGSISRSSVGPSNVNFKDLYRSNYANGRLTPPSGYHFDVEKAKLVPAKRLRKQSEILRDGLLYRGKHLMEEFMPTTRPRPALAAPASGYYTIEAAGYGHKAAERGESRLGEAASKKLTVFGKPPHRIGSRGINNDLMYGEQVALRELTIFSVKVSAQDFAKFERAPQENRLYLLNTNDFLHFFDTLEKDGQTKDKSRYKVIKVLGVRKGSDGPPRSAAEVAM